MGVVFFLGFLGFILFVGVVIFSLGIILNTVNKNTKKKWLKVVSMIAMVVGIILCLMPLVFALFIFYANTTSGIEDFISQMLGYIAHR